MTTKIDRTGETLTPEQAQKGEGAANEDKAAEAKAAADAKAAEEAKAKEEADAKAAADAKAQEEADAKAKAEAEGKSEKLEKKPRSIYDDLKDKKKEAREAKSEAEIVKAENAALKAENEALKKLAESAKTATTDEEKEELDEDIKQVAEAIGGDPKSVKILTEFLQKRLVKKDGSGISKEDIEAVKNFKSQQEKASVEVEFNKEWKAFVPDLKKDFPHISDEDMEAVKAKIFALAHSKGFNDLEIDYIYFKNKDSLSKLVSPKRPSMEGSGNAPAGDGKKAEPEFSSKSSPMDVMKAMENDMRGPSTDIRRSQ